MFPTSPPARRALLTPCIGVCELRSDGLCAGCHRSGEEIAAWPTLDDEQRRRLMDEILPQRQAAAR